ncbi:MAG: hypothetical protein KQH63_18780 [Desulfobulbaceae bacterium]|nr:hypothetical protein [Desulfobulbaceae bacterium]
MIKDKKCCCLFASACAFIAILIITYVSGYSMGNWTMTTWFAVFVILSTAAFCLRCRQKEDEGQD